MSIIFCFLSSSDIEKFYYIKNVIPIYKFLLANARSRESNYFYTLNKMISDGSSELTATDKLLVDINTEDLTVEIMPVLTTFLIDNGATWT